MPTRGDAPNGTVQRPLRVGVLGLGKRWQKRYGPALEALADRFQIRAVCDPLRERADHEARRLGCAAVAGPTELLEIDGLDAMLLLDRPWYGLWPLQLASRRRLPVFCAPSLELEGRHADALVESVRRQGGCVMMERELPLAPATALLGQLQNGRLGQARLMVCDWGRRGRPFRHDSPLLGSAGDGVLDWIVSLMGAAPTAVTACAARGIASVLLEFPEGRAAHIVRYRVARGSVGLRVRVVTDRGQAVCVPPCRLSWQSSAGRRTREFPRPTPVGQRLLEQFRQIVLQGQSVEPGLGQAHRALTWLRAIARSRAEGRRVIIDEESLSPGSA